MRAASQLEKFSSSVRSEEDEKRAVALVQEGETDLVVAHIIQPHPTVPEVMEEVDKWYRCLQARDSERGQPIQSDEPGQNPRAEKRRADRCNPERLKGSCHLAPFRRGSRTGS